MSHHSTDRRHGLWLAAGLALCGAVAVVGLAPSGLASYGTPINVAISGSGDTLPGIHSDGKGTYYNGVDSVEAVLDASGNLHLKLVANGLPDIRTLCLNFSVTVTSAGTGAPFTAKCVDAFMSTNSVASGSTMYGGLLQMPIPTDPNNPTTAVANLNVVFVAGNGSGLQWFLRYNPSQPYGYPGSTQVKVTRVDEHNWTIEASPTDIPATDIAGLLSAPTKGKLVTTEEGLFSMPTTIMINCPTC